MTGSDTSVGMSGKKATSLTGVEQLHSKVDSQHVIATAADYMICIIRCMWIYQLLHNIINVMILPVMTIRQFQRKASAAGVLLNSSTAEVHILFSPRTYIYTIDPQIGRLH